MITARPRNEEDGMSARRGAVPGARIFHPFMREISPEAARPLVPDSHTMTRRAGDPGRERFPTIVLRQTQNPWKQFLTGQLAGNFSPLSPMSCAARWQQSRQLYERCPPRPQSRQRSTP
jgi:hypothetical protein